MPTSSGLVDWHRHDLHVAKLLADAKSILRPIATGDDPHARLATVRTSRDHLEGTVAYAQAVLARDEGALALVAMVWPDVVTLRDEQDDDAPGEAV